MIMPETIESAILQYLDEWKIQPPIAIKTYYSVKPSGLGTTWRAGKRVFLPASPKEGTEKFSYYVDENLNIFEITEDMRIQNP